MNTASLLSRMFQSPARGLKNDLEIHPLGGNGPWNTTDNTEYFIRDDRTFLFPAPPTTAAAAATPLQPPCLPRPSHPLLPDFFSTHLTTSHGHITAVPLSLQADLCSVRCPVVMLSSSLANHI